MATLRIENAYSDGHTSTSEVQVPEPASLSDDDMEDWWDDVVFPHTGDGHGIGVKLGSCYIATVTAAADGRLVGQSHEWID